MRRARRSKPLTARRRFAASCSARERATSTDASVLEAPCLCYHGSLAEKQRRSWDARMTWPAAVAVALGFASPVMGAAVRWPSRMMSAATRPGAPASGARGRRGGEKHGAWMSDAPASGGRSPSQPPDQRLQARQPGAAEASASAGRGAAAAPWSQRGAVRPERSVKTPSQFLANFGGANPSQPVSHYYHTYQRSTWSTCTHTRS